MTGELSASAFTATDRRALASVATQFFVNGAVFASFVPRLPEIRDRIDVSLGELGATMTAAAVVGVAGGFVAPALLKRFGTRWSLIVGAVVLISMLPAIGFSTTLLAFGLSLAVMQAFDVVVDVAMNLQGSWLSARRHAPVMNRLHGLWSLGTVVGGIAAAQVAAAGVSLQTHLVVVTGILAVALVFVGRGLLREDQDVDEVTDGGRNGAARSALVLIALAGAFAIAVEIISSDWAAFRLKDDFDTSAGFAGLGFVAYTSGMTIGRFSGDAIEARWGAQRMLTSFVAVAAVGLTAASFFPNRWVVLAAYCLAGLGNSTMFPKLYDDAAKMPGAKGAGLGALTAGSRVMVLIAPVIIGSLASTSLSVGAAVAVITLPSIVGFAVIVLGSLRRR